VKRIALFSASAIVLVLAACSRDGRSLRAPRPDQNQSIVTTTATPTTVAGAVINPPKVAPGLPQPVFSASWASGQPLPATAACKGISPELSWANVPGEISELAVTMVDLQNGNAGHWIIAGLSPSSTGLQAGTIPAGAIQAKNYILGNGWAPPCPNTGTHTYLFTLYFLERPSGLLPSMLSVTAVQTLDLAAGSRLTLTGTVTAG
jgi:phosphatidylethanolamine-binding protein (PEBP) family uncharacterized protein